MDSREHLSGHFSIFFSKYFKVPQFRGTQFTQPKWRTEGDNKIQLFNYAMKYELFDKIFGLFNATQVRKLAYFKFSKAFSRSVE